MWCLGTGRCGFLSWVHIRSDDRCCVLGPWKGQQRKLVHNVPVPRPLLSHHGNAGHHTHGSTLQGDTTS